MAPMNCPAMPPGGGRGMKFRKTFSPITRKITPARYRAIMEAVLITGFSFSIGRHCIGVTYIDVNRIDDVYFWEIQVFYDARHSRDGPRLASNDEGDALPDKIRIRWY